VRIRDITFKVYPRIDFADYNPYQCYPMILTSVTRNWIPIPQRCSVCLQ